MNYQEIKIKVAETAQDFLDAKKLITEYAEWIGIDLSFQNFDKEIDNLQEMYGNGNGGLLLSLVNDHPVGVAGIRKFADKESELKRMFVKPAFRNLGLGKLLLTEAIELAKRLNYEIVKLDTADFMKAAIKLYTENGFVEIPAYRYNPHKEARYFALTIKDQ